MKRIRMIEIPSPTWDKEKNPQEWEADRVDYIVCTRNVMRAPRNPQAGTDFEESRKAIRVLKLLDGMKPGELLALEDDDHKNLAERVVVFRWPVNDERLVRYVQTVLDAQDWPIDATPAEQALVQVTYPEPANATA